MNRRIKFSILAIIILIAISIYWISQKEIEPQPAILKIDGKEQISGIGSYCWRGTLRSLCADMIGMPTAQEQLTASSPFTAHLRLPLQEPPYELQFNIFQVAEKDELNFNGSGWRWWRTNGGGRFTLPLEREPDIELSLEPGLYVLSIYAWWKEEGSASYSFLVEVQADGKPEVLKVNPVIEYDPLEEYPDKSEGLFTVIKGSIPEVKENLKNIVIKKAAQTSIFSANDDLNLVVFRGVFSTGGYGINIDRVEKQGNIFTVYATYRDPGKGIGVTEAFTRPTAIIPIGKLAEGDYEARLRMTWVLDTVEGGDVIEPEKELSVYDFKVKPADFDIGNSREKVSSVSSGYLAGQVFDESAGNFTKKWDATNFAGFWRDPETNVSTETLVIDQSVLNNSHRIIEKHNLIYTTRSIPVKYQVYMHANQTPAGTEGFYSAVGWMGEKHVYLQGNRLAKIIFEQNASDVKIITTGYSWRFGEGYKLFAHSIEAPLEREAWIEFLNGTNSFDEKVLPDRYLYSYPADVNNNIPTFITYISSIHRGNYEDMGEFKYTWLRSQNVTGIKEGDIFGVMEVTSVENGTIELRNKNPIDLSPGNTVHLMGDISIQVASSETGLLFYPTKGRI